MSKTQNPTPAPTVLNKRTMTKTPVAKTKFTMTYNFVFIAVLFLTLFSAGMAVWISRGDPNSQYQISKQNDLFKLFCDSWKLGFGAMLGLLGGRIVK